MPRVIIVVVGCEEVEAVYTDVPDLVVHIIEREPCSHAFEVSQLPLVHVSREDRIVLHSIGAAYEDLGDLCL